MGQGQWAIMYVSNRKGDHLEQCHLMIHEIIDWIFCYSTKKIVISSHTKSYAKPENTWYLVYYIMTYCY